jgi:carbonic anhydrase
MSNPQKYSYQSPITLDSKDYIKVKQHIEIYGRNENAIYNPVTKNYEVKRKVILTLNDKKYKLDEYHFHIPSEHKVNGQKYASEIHYVFVEYDVNNIEEEEKRECSDVCGCNHPKNKNILVIGRIILDAGQHKHLEDLHVKVPHYYFQYDGTLTTGNYSPVRWIIGETPVHYCLSQITRVAKGSRELQELDGRIILFSEK